MPDLKISQLPVSTTPSTNAAVPIVEGGKNYQATVQSLVTVASPVQSVAGRTGSIVLSHADVGNAPSTLAQFTASQDNLSLGTGGIVRISSNAAVNITGFVASSDGDARVLVNTGAFAITLLHQSTGSDAANRILCDRSANIVIQPDTTAVVIYDATTGRWRASGAQAVAATDVTGLGTMAVQDANSVSITGGTISKITDLAIADGGTGASTAIDARFNLGAASNATYASDLFQPLGLYYQAYYPDTLLPDIAVLFTSCLGLQQDGKAATAGEEQFPVAPSRIWANIQGTAGPTITGTYSQTGTTITVTVTTPSNYAFGYINGFFQFVRQSSKTWLTFTTGTPSAPTNGLYTCTEDGTVGGTTLAANQFRVTAATSVTRSGNVTIQMRTIRQSSGGVMYVAYQGVGDYYVNFMQFWPDIDYVPMLQLQRGDAANTYGFATVASTTGNANTLETGGFRVRCFNSAGTAIDPVSLYLTVTR